MCSLPATWLQLSCHSALPAGEDGELRENKVRSMATQLLAKFEENSSTVQKRSKVRRFKRRGKDSISGHSNHVQPIALQEGFPPLTSRENKATFEPQEI